MPPSTPCSWPGRRPPSPATAPRVRPSRHGTGPGQEAEDAEQHQLEPGDRRCPDGHRNIRERLVLEDPGAEQSDAEHDEQCDDQHPTNLIDIDQACVDRAWAAVSSLPRSTGPDPAA